jgi:hypothetical protein
VYVYIIETMPRNYIRKTEPRWDKAIIKLAINDYINDVKPSCNKSAKKFGIPEPTLRRYLKKKPEVNYFVNFKHQIIYFIFAIGLSDK